MDLAIPRRGFLSTLALAALLPGCGGRGLPSSKLVKTLVVAGGEVSDEPAFRAVFDGLPALQCTHTRLADESEVFDDISRWDYDALVLHHETQEISELRRANFLALLDRGLGVVVLHHGLAAFQDWDEYRRIVGGKYYLRETIEDGQTRPPSSSRENVDFIVRVEDADHPITRGLTDFPIRDMLYQDYRVEPGVRVLLATGEPGSGGVLCWVHEYRKSRICYLQLGHDAQALNHPAYRTLVERAVLWTARR